MAGHVEKLLEDLAAAGDLPEPRRSALLRKGMAHKQGMVVHAAVKVVRRRALTSFVPEFESLFASLLDKPELDRGCTIKMLILETLKEWESIPPSLLRAATRHRQLEPVYGGSVDTAAPMRAWAVNRLSEAGDPHLLPILCEMLYETPGSPKVQDEPSPRIAAARVLGQYRLDSAALLLRAKMLGGDAAREANVADDVIGEVVGALFCTQMSWAEPLVDAAIPTLSEGQLASLAISLGEQRSARAARLLLKHWPTVQFTDAAEPWQLGLALSRQDDAVDFLLEQVRTGSKAHARSAVAALSNFRTESLTTRLKAAIAARPDHDVTWNENA